MDLSINKVDGVITEKEANRWVRHIINDLSINFHPDNVAEEYVDKNENPTFDKEQCREFNKVMCDLDETDIDLYKLALDCFLEKEG